jgi:hypothetical protein
VLKTIAKNHEFEANINGADLTAQALAANPGAVLFDTVITLDVYPGSFAHGLTTSTPDLVILSSPPFLMTNCDLGQVLYGNPYPKDWPQFSSYSWGALTSYLASGAKQHIIVNRRFWQHSKLTHVHQSDHAVGWSGEKPIR